MTGIISGSLCPFSVYLAFTGLIPFSFIIITKHYRRLLILVGLFTISFFSGNYLYTSNLPDNTEDVLNFYNGRENLLIKGTVSRDPEPGDKNIRLIIDVQAVFTDEEWSNITGTALVFVPLYSEYNYGDLLLIEGSLQDFIL